MFPHHDPTRVIVLQLFVVLLSDLLLLTRPDQDGYLSVIQDPIILHTIDSVNVNCPQRQSHSSLVTLGGLKGWLHRWAP